MSFSSALLKKIIAVYLAIGGVICLLFFFYQLGLSGILSYLLPAAFSILILTYTIISAARYFFKPDKTGSQLLASCLAIQSIYFMIEGLVFENHFGPFLGIAAADESGLTFSFQFSILNFITRNGYSSAPEVMVVGINLVPVALLVLIDLAEKREKKANAEDEFKIGEQD